MTDPAPLQTDATVPVSASSPSNNAVQAACVVLVSAALGGVIAAHPKLAAISPQVGSIASAIVLVAFGAWRMFVAKVRAERAVKLATGTHRAVLTK